MNTLPSPSLLGAHAPLPATSIAAPAREEKSLLDLMYDGFYLLFLLREKSFPSDPAHFIQQIQKFLADFEKGAKRLNASAEDIFSAKYAFCAAVDEIVLRSESVIRDSWERRPLQLMMFGDQLAGENFFLKLDALRSQGQARLQVMEVFHMCLLLGFQGKYFLEGPEKLGYLTARLGDEIAAMRGRRVGFAPHWELPDLVAHTLRRDVPLWVIAAAFACIGLLAFIGLSWSLNSTTQTVMGQYGGVVKLAPRVAHLTITLP